MGWSLIPLHSSLASTKISKTAKETACTRCSQADRQPTIQCPCAEPWHTHLGRTRRPTPGQPQTAEPPICSQRWPFPSLAAHKANLTRRASCGPCGAFRTEHARVRVAQCLTNKCTPCVSSYISRYMQTCVDASDSSSHTRASSGRSVWKKLRVLKSQIARDKTWACTRNATRRW